MRHLLHPLRQNPDLYYQKLSKDQDLQEKDKALCMESFTYFLGHVKTLDSHDEKHPVKFFPYKGYLLTLIELLLTVEKLLIIKSRQIMVTWLLCAFLLWKVLRTEGALVLIQVKTGPDANEVIKTRIYEIWSKLPKHLKDSFVINPSKKGKHLENTFEVANKKSYIRALKQGQDQSRMRTVTVYYGDEFQLMDDKKGTLRGTEPSTKQMVLSGTAKNDLEWREMAKEPKGDPNVEEVSHGIKKWKNEDGYIVVQVHFWADPDKDPDTEQGKAWVQKERERISDDARWQQEYMINWEAVGEEVKFPFFRQNYKAYVKPVEYNPRLPLLLGWDFGYHPAPQVCKIQQLVVYKTETGQQAYQLRVIETIIVNQEYSETFIPRIINYIHQKYHPHVIYNFIDPEGSYNDRRGASELSIMIKCGLRNIKKKKVEDPEKARLVNTILMPNPDGSSRLIISPINNSQVSTCEKHNNNILIEALDTELKASGDNKIKAGHPHNDVFDAFTYTLAHILDPMGNAYPHYSQENISVQQKSWFQRVIESRKK